jgi:3-oxoacyl-[acyl-carrier protein] reductase
MSQMNGQVAIVTGAARGIGAATARALVELGAAVVLNDVDADAASQTLQELRSGGASASTVIVDASTAEGAAELIQTVLAQHGRVDALVNNAGFGGSRQRPVPLSVLDTDWDQMLDSFRRNLGPTFHCTRAVVPSMREHGYGRIVNVSSLAGRARSVLSGPSYATAKAAVIGLTRHLSAELASYGITINVVAPGMTFTDRVRGNYEAKAADQQQDILRGIPMKRAGTPEEQAAAIAFLSSPGSSYITGAVLDVNGGLWVG